MSDKYTGEKCIVCGELFADGDDIVVCPDCGTPCHRSCWEKSGECTNTALHESGESWKPTAKVSYTPPDGQPIRCIRCGALNDGDSHFCSECGLPLNFDRESSRPFNDIPENEEGTPGIPQMPNMQMRTIRLTPQSDMAGVRLGDYMEYIGSRSFNIIASFIKFAKTGRKVSFNIAALIFPELYFFYRKMTKTGVIFLLLSFLLSIPVMIYNGQSGEFGGMILFSTPIDIKSRQFTSFYELCWIINVTVSVFASSYANYWYYKKAREDITSIRAEETVSEHETVDLIRRKGGTSWVAVGAAAIAIIILKLGFMLALTYVY